MLTLCELLATEATIAQCEVSDSAQKVHATKVGAECFHKVELTVSALPQQKVTQALLAACSYDKVRVWLPARVKVLADHLWRELRRQIVEGSTVLVVRRNNAAHGVNDFGAPTVTNRKVDVHPWVLGRALFRLVKHLREVRRQNIVAADVLDPPNGTGSRQRIGEISNDPDEVAEFLLVALCEVVCREKVKRHDLDAQFVAPREKLAHFRGARPVPVGGRREAELLRPTPVAIDHHGDVVGHLVGIDASQQSALVQPIQRAPFRVLHGGCGACVHVPTLCQIVGRIPDDSGARYAPSEGETGCSVMSKHAVQWHRNASTVQRWKISWNPKWFGHGFGFFMA